MVCGTARQMRNPSPQWLLGTFKFETQGCLSPRGLLDTLKFETVGAGIAMPRLADLDARFVRHHAGPPETYEHVDALADADGLMFLCPKCFGDNGGPVGTHSVLCWFVGHVADDVDPKPGRWIPSGTGLADLTFVGPAAASVQLLGGCNWHGFVRSGEATLS